MFDLEQSIAEWRKQMQTAGIKSPLLLEELENHLREEIELQLISGLNEERAFEISTQKIGEAKFLKTEFKKIEAGHWNHSLTWFAWILFVASFFLPAYANEWGHTNEWGWWCALASANCFVSPDFWRGNGLPYHLGFLTLANVLMIGSPFLLLYFAQKPAFRKWFGVSTFVALALVWSFIFRLLMDPARSDIRFGCFVWGFSFLPLCLSLLPVWRRKITSLKYV
jgi:hypothetical protein